MDRNKFVYLVGFFRFDEKGSQYGFERMDLMGIFETEEDARKYMSFCDEAGWYEGALIEKRGFGNQFFQNYRDRVWLVQNDKGEMIDIPEPEHYKNIVGLIG